MLAEIIKIHHDSPEASLVKYAAEQIRAGQVLGMPTDTFYGLAADPLNLRAVERVYEIKSRSRHKPLSLLIESVDQAEDLARPLPKEFYDLARRFWPGPLTIIVRAASGLPLKVTANTGNVALRIPSAKIPLAVIQAAGIPITATSANLSGASECTTAEQVRDQLQDRINIIVDGGTSPREVASTIVDLSNGDTVRSLAAACPDIDILVNNAGAIPAGDLQAIDEARWRDAWNLKVFGYINLCRAVYPAMKARGGGVIVNVLGAAGERPTWGYIAGSAGNASLMAFTRGMGGTSLVDRIRIVACNPGLIRTERMETMLRASAQTKFGDPARWQELIPTNPPVGTPEQCADLVAFLASDRASHIAGTVVTIDGGAAHFSGVL